MNETYSEDAQYERTNENDIMKLTVRKHTHNIDALMRTNLLGGIND